MDNVNFINKDQREKLEVAYGIIKDVSDKLSLDDAEFAVIRTTLEYLKRTIEYEYKFY